MKKEQISEIFEAIRRDPALKKDFLALLIEGLDMRNNPYHPLVFIQGPVKFGKDVAIGLFSELNAIDSSIEIGDNCDIASFVSLNVADSYKKCIGKIETVERKPITLENNVFVGSHCFIGGGTHIAHHSVVAAGTVVLKAGHVPPYSLIVGNPAIIKDGYFLKNKKQVKATT